MLQVVEWRGQLKKEWKALVCWVVGEGWNTLVSGRTLTRHDIFHDVIAPEILGDKYQVMACAGAMLVFKGKREHISS